jgi:deoxyhypusine synthase
MVDRMHDILADEVRFREHDLWIGSFAARLDQRRPYTTREFLYLLGKEIAGEAKEDGIVSAAAKAGVPLFCPAIADSSIGIGVAESRHRGENKLMFDMMADVLEITNVVADSPATGVIYFGGGTPKNYVQQTEVVAMLMNRDKSGHRYGLQVVTDAPHWGGLSGCTFEESQSWGKLAKGATMVNCHCDSTIAMPLLVSGLAEHKDLIARRKPPTFDMAPTLKVKIQV